MSLFDNLLGNLDDIAGKLGLPADQVHAVVQSLQAKVAGGGNMLAALTQTAQEHGISLDSLKGLIGSAGAGAGGGANDLLGQVTGALDRDGDGNPLNDLGSLAKGLFGKS
jgi:hypothetical protein